MLVFGPIFMVLIFSLSLMDFTEFLSDRPGSVLRAVNLRSSSQPTAMESATVPKNRDNNKSYRGKKLVNSDNNVFLIL